MAVAVSCNDVNMKGVPCRWVLTTILLSKRENLEGEISGIREACSIIGCHVVGGHTEVTRGIDNDIVISTAISLSEKVISVKDARAGDYVVMVGSAGIEGTWILSHMEDLLLSKGVSKETIIRAKEFKKRIIVQDRALKVSDVVIGMHDATEGGVLQDLLEISRLSKLRVEVDPSKIPVEKETLEISKVLSIDYLRLISSGSFVVVTRFPEEVIRRVGGSVIGRLEKGEPALYLKGIGEFRENFEEELIRVEGNYNGWRKRN
nr:AIR synthase-related protein [Acidianus sp. RZ1]